MSDQKHIKSDRDSFDELLKAALSYQMEEEAEREAEEMLPEHVFSEQFRNNINELIARADEIAESTGTSGETSDPINETSDKMPAEEKAEAAQARMAGKIIPFSLLRAHRKAFANAASLLLVFGLGFFFLKESGIMMPSGAASAKAEITETTAAAVPAPASADLNEAGAAVPDAAAAAPRAALFSAAPNEDEQRDEGNGAVAAETGVETQMETEAMADSAEERASGSSESGKSARIANPVQEVKDSEAIYEMLGIRLSVPEALGTDFQYHVISGTLAEIGYLSRGLASPVTYRAAAFAADGAETGSDISGIYYSFDETRTEVFAADEADPDSPEMKLQFADSESSKGALVTWNADGNVYSFWVEDASAGAEPVKAEARAAFAG
ncbi:MAG: hypothetical protein Q4C63_03210 [Eubacteriales bacterium]|nr:hypothetical protein [Eubacteriales bacterium]